MKASTRTTKRCTKCHSVKSTSEFARKTSTRTSSWCKACVRVNNRMHYHDNKEKYRQRNQTRRQMLREWLRERKSLLACALCGENHPACLEFHHADPSQKEITVALAVSGFD